MSTPEQKAALRRDLLKYREELTASQIMAASHEIMTRCADIIPWQNVKSLHTYVPIAERKEVNSWWLLEYVWEHQPQVATAVPVVRDGQILSVQVDDSTQWQENTIGIPEPQDVIPLNLNQPFDVIIVPVLGFDRQGNRLGYGKGHYDRFLETQPHALTVGLAYTAAEIKPLVPAESHDIAVQYIVTEKGVITFQARRQTS